MKVPLEGSSSFARGVLSPRAGPPEAAHHASWQTREWSACPAGPRRAAPGEAGYPLPHPAEPQVQRRDDQHVERGRGEQAAQDDDGHRRLDLAARLAA